MQAATLEALEQASIPAHQARALARAFEIEMSVERAELATKADLALGLEKLGGELRAEIQAVRHELRTEVQTLRTEMQAMKSELVRWLFTLMLAQTTVVFAGVYLIVKLMLAAALS